MDSVNEIRAAIDAAYKEGAGLSLSSDEVYVLWNLIRTLEDECDLLSSMLDDRMNRDLLEA